MLYACICIHFHRFQHEYVSPGLIFAYTNFCVAFFLPWWVSQNYSSACIIHMQKQQIQHDRSVNNTRASTSSTSAIKKHACGYYVIPHWPPQLKKQGCGYHAIYFVIWANHFPGPFISNSYYLFFFKSCLVLKQNKKYAHLCFNFFVALLFFGSIWHGSGWKQPVIFCHRFFGALI